MSNSLREALSDATAALEDILDAFSRGEGGVYKSDVEEVIDAARAALAAPQRNCDVGTPEEQDRRFDAFCKSYKEHHGNCFGCAALRTSGDCKVSWMRMPCEEKGSEG